MEETETVGGSDEGGRHEFEIGKGTLQVLIMIRSTIV